MAERPWSGCLSGRTATRCSLRGRGSDDECVADAAAQPALRRRHQSQTTRGAGRQPTRPGQGRPHPGRRPPLHRPHPTAPARTRTSRRRVIRRRRQGSAIGSRAGVSARNSATNSPPKRADSSLGWDHAAAAKVRHCEGCSEARVQHHSLPAGATGFPARSSYVPVRVEAWSPAANGAVSAARLARWGPS
jgi:hypothetical protein